MNFGRVKAGAGYGLGVLLAIFFVALLSYIFSFLGTIFCAAVGGMMLGAMPGHKWQSIPASLLFPLVLFGLLRGMKSELGGDQVLVVVVICFAAFWVAYGVARLLFFYEQARPAQAGVQRQAAPGNATPTVGAGDGATAVTGAGCEREGLLSLEMLQGDWAREMETQPRAEKRRLCFERESMTLSVVDSSEHVKVLARVTVKLCNVDSAPTLLISGDQILGRGSKERQQV